MWNKRSLWLCLRVKKRGSKPRISLRILLSLYALHQLLLSYEPLALLTCGKAGRASRLGLDSIHTFLLGIMNSQPQTYAHVEVEDNKDNILVDIKTAGWIIKEGDD